MWVSLKHDGTDGTVKSVNTDGTAIERADGTANTGANYQIITYKSGIYSEKYDANFLKPPEIAINM